MNRTYGLIAAVLVGVGLLWFAGAGGFQGNDEHSAHEALVGTSLYEAAVMDPSRPKADVERDAGRRPQDVLAFMGVEPGMTVVEYQAGGGYYTRLLSYVVGPNGRVIAQQGPNPSDERRAQLAALGDALGNIETVYVSRPELTQPENSVDLVVVILIYHHMNYSADEGDVLPAGTVQALNNIKAMLKPGGKLVVVDHAALDSVTRAETAAVHRVSPARTRADLEAAGFTFEGESTVLVYPDDPMNIMWRGNIPRDQSSRMVHKYRYDGADTQ